ncbi:glycosyl hydrolase family 28-related protein [Bradyrhizobium sp. 174]|uniref:glycosyl hydrolase family 28-related protein n=1 Tax=Bradyrhizobium sp. 174 TaxID=2782645 RepID=UPI001FF77261|nr:glycosyl hydrolase family 28-related protein [Bradyrhizobium sp. 174]MCK1573660.1 hypothetical protein [Bradyrhizobium sp. 174]
MGRRLGQARPLRNLRFFLLLTLATLANCLAMQPLSAAPTVLWASDPVAPDETVLVMGDQLTDGTDIWIRRLVDDPTHVTPPATQSYNVKPIQASPTSLKFVLPREPGPGVYGLSFSKEGGVAHQLNAPSVYWSQGDLGRSSSIGGWIRVFGRNIARNSEVRITLTPLGQSAEVTLRASSSSLWEATFQVPSDFSPGPYAVRLWNGNGDASAWREVGILEVRTRLAPPTLTLNVKEFGGVGDGIHDDTESLKAAIYALDQRGGGTVMLPRGQYRLSQALTIPPRTTLRGEDRSLVRLVWSEFATPPYALIEGSTDFAIEDLTIFAGNHGHVISGGFLPASDDSEADARNITLRRITVRASMYRGHLTPEQTTERFVAALKFSSGGPDTVRLSGENLTIEDCDLYGSGRSLFLREPHGAYIRGNKFYNGRWGWYSISGADGVIFERNEVIGADLQSTGGGVNTLHRVTQFSQNVAFLRNHFEMIQGWDREAMTSDGPRGCYYGPIASISLDERSATLPDNTADKKIDLRGCLGAGIFILDGKGVGQVRRIQAVEGSTILLDHPFNVQPDTSSIATVTSYQRNYLMIENDFSDAGIAVQFWGSSVNHIVAGNIARRTSGFLNRGVQYQRAYQPTWYTQFLNNQILEGDLGADAVLGTWGIQRPPNRSPLSVGTIMRGNQLKGNAHIEVRGYSKAAPGVRDTIVENNLVENAQTGILIDDGTSGVFLRDNRFSHVSVEVNSVPAAPR